MNRWIIRDLIDIAGEYPVQATAVTLQTKQKGATVAGNPMSTTPIAIVLFLFQWVNVPLPNTPRLPNGKPILTDGRGFPKDTPPTWMGYSIGKWEGDTFVVDSIGFNDQTYIDDGGHPHTEAYHSTERFHRPDFGHMDYEITIDDPKAYTRPWKATVPFDLFADNE